MKKGMKKGAHARVRKRSLPGGDGRGPSRPSRESAFFFASFGAFFPALRVPTISEHLTRARYPY